MANTNIENVNIALTNDLLLLTSCIFYLRTTTKEEKTAQHLKYKQKNLKTFRFRQHKYVSESRHWKKNSHRPHRCVMWNKIEFYSYRQFMFLYFIKVCRIVNGRSFFFHCAHVLLDLVLFQSRIHSFCHRLVVDPNWKVLYLWSIATDRVVMFHDGTMENNGLASIRKWQNNV